MTPNLTPAIIALCVLLIVQIAVGLADYGIERAQIDLTKNEWRLSQ